MKPLFLFLSIICLYSCTRHLTPKSDLELPFVYNPDRTMGMYLEQIGPFDIRFSRINLEKDSIPFLKLCEGDSMFIENKKGEIVKIFFRNVPFSYAPPYIRSGETKSDTFDLYSLLLYDVPDGIYTVYTQDTYEKIDKSNVIKFKLDKEKYDRLYYTMGKIKIDILSDEFPSKITVRIKNEMDFRFDLQLISPSLSTIEEDDAGNFATPQFLNRDIRTYTQQRYLKPNQSIDIDLFPCHYIDEKYMTEKYGFIFNVSLKNLDWVSETKILNPFKPSDCSGKQK